MDPKSNSIEISITSEYPSYEYSESIEAFVDIHLKAAECEARVRIPIDIVIVLDISGSMAGDKLKFCKETIMFLIEQLSPEDRLGLITYDTNVYTNFNLMKMNSFGKTKATETLLEIEAKSSTNLSGGLLAGIQEIQSVIRKDGDEVNQIMSVLLLTDGQANVGLVGKDLTDSLKKIIKPETSIFTFGYGFDHNSCLLKEISEIGNGSYYFVENLDVVSLSFADCLGGLMSVMAQNIKLSSSALKGAKIEHIYTKKNCHSENNQEIVDLGDIYGGEERDILIKMKLPTFKSPESQCPIISCELSFFNVQTSAFETMSATLFVNRSTGNSLDCKPDENVFNQKNRILVIETIEKAQSLCSAGKVDMGKNTIEELIKDFEDKLPIWSKNEVGADLIKDLRNCSSRMENLSSYKTRGMHAMNAIHQNHITQRMYYNSAFEHNEGESNFANLKCFAKRDMVSKARSAMDKKTDDADK